MLSDRQRDLLIAVALTEFSVHYERADRLVDHDVEPAEAVDALEIGSTISD
ncbi:hypothetical protein [Natrinema sp. SYSU A 869]|uniref:hypothetical protein n=1 Tax=Natrinema sp. SYSU A 869 TaxID=2871694 RepID=UPI001CA394F6|nr:hypothetical protein [Natrinema sp. SYSU A 869]